MRHYKSLFYVFIFFSGGCTFSPHNENINPIQPPGPLSYIIEVNHPEFTDPYYLISPTQFQFTLKGVSKRIIGYEVTFNDYPITASENGENIISFHLFPNTYPDGYHRVDIRIRVATETGSLAEKLGAEYYLIEKSFTVITDRIPPALSAPPRLTYENGYLTLRWNAPTKKNFYYEIKRIYQPYYPLQDTLIVNTEQDHFIDYGYVGGDITYKIVVTGYGFYQHEIGSVDLFDQPPVDFTLNYDANRVVTLSWTHSKINTNNTSIVIQSGEEPITIPLQQMGQLVIDTLALAEDRNYFIETTRAGYHLQANTVIKGVNSIPNLKAFNNFAMLPQHNKLLIQSPGAVYRYSLPALILEDSLTALQMGLGDLSSLVVSEDESKAIVVAGAVGLVSFDPLNFSHRASYNIYNASIPATGNTNSVHNIVLGNLSNTSLLTLTLTKLNDKWGMVYDLNADVMRWSSAKFIYFSFFRPPVISSNGEYLVYDHPGNPTGQVFIHSDDEFNLLGNVESGRKFFRSNTTELISATPLESYESYSQYSFSIFDLNAPPTEPEGAFTKIRSFILPKWQGSEMIWGLSYDPATQVLYTRYMENAFSIIRLYDISNFQLIEKVKAMSYTPYVHVYANNYHLTGRGFIEPIK